MKSLTGPIILVLIAAYVYLASLNAKKIPIKKDWDRIRACIARSQKILNDEAMKSHRLIDWDNVTPEQSDAHKRLTSQLTVKKYERDAQCRERYSF